jgi:hypothetical protein
MYFAHYLCAVTTLCRHPAQLTFLYEVNLTLFVFSILCVSHSHPQFNFQFFILPSLCQFVNCFALQWLPHHILLGTSALQAFGLCPFSLNFLTWLVTI